MDEYRFFSDKIDQAAPATRGVYPEPEQLIRFRKILLQ
jgi:hypothetical protein